MKTFCNRFPATLHLSGLVVFFLFFTSAQLRAYGSHATPTPNVGDEWVANVGMTSATLNAIASPYDVGAKYLFLYSTDGVSWSHTDTLVTLVDITFTMSSAISSLLPNTSYLYYAEIINSVDTARGAMNIFSTLASPIEYLPNASTIALYHFDGLEGNKVIDYSSSRYDGFSTAATAVGQFGNARHFDFQSEMVEITDADSVLSMGNKNFTVEAWVYPNLLGVATLPMARKGDFNSSKGSFELDVMPDGQVSLILSGDGINMYHVSTPPSSVADNAWNHIAAAVDFSNQLVNIFINHTPQTITPNGSFPSGGLLRTAEPVIIGLPMSPPAPGPYYALVDEFRISKKALTASDFIQNQNQNIVMGSVFGDQNGDGIRNPGEMGLQGWTVFAYHSGDPSKTPIASDVTDANGNYILQGLPEGKFIVAEIEMTGFIKTVPSGDGYPVTLATGTMFQDLNFGNIAACYYLGGPMSSASSWSCLHIPTNGEAVVFSGTSGSSTVSSLPFYVLSFLRVDSTAHVIFNYTGSLHVTGQVTIRNGGTLAFDPSNPFVTLSCEGSWFNYGFCNPGASTVIFSGDKPKVIGYGDFAAGTSGGSTARNTPPRISSTSAAVPGNVFYNLVISGGNTSTEGNITINNNLHLDNTLSTRSVDTITIAADADTALNGEGLITHGTIKRQIRTHGTGMYRFESGLSAILFSPGFLYPGSVTETVCPDSNDHSLALFWEPVDAVINPVMHQITATGVNHFTKWIVGKPGGLAKRRSVAFIGGFIEGFDTTEVVHRFYSITPEANNGQFSATLSLRYDPSEIGSALNEASLALYRGPYVIDTMAHGWNMISVPMVPEDLSSAGLFPRKASEAYNYNNNLGYAPAIVLAPGTGYWLKFNSVDHDTIQGAEIDSITIPVTAGWNMIGSITYPTTLSALSSPDGVTFTNLFGYRRAYYQTSTLEAYRAYWLKASKDGHITIRTPSSAKVSPRSTGANDLPCDVKHVNILRVRDAAGNEQSLYFGLEATLGAMNRWEMPPSPPAGIYDARFHGNMMAAVTPAEGKSIIPLDLQSEQYPLTLEWTINIGLDNTLLRIGDRSYVLDRSGSARLMVSAPIALTLPAQTAGTIHDYTIPNVYALYQNFPNPFNPVTSIRFDLPAPAQVTLAVYDLLGQEVASLIHSEQYPAGAFQVPFDASRLASGVYIYKLTAGKEFSSVRKLIFVK